MQNIDTEYRHRVQDTGREDEKSLGWTVRCAGQGCGGRGAELNIINM